MDRGQESWNHILSLHNKLMCAAYRQELIRRLLALGYDHYLVERSVELLREEELLPLVVELWTKEDSLNPPLVNQYIARPRFQSVSYEELRQARLMGMEMPQNGEWNQATETVASQAMSPITDEELEGLKQLLASVHLSSVKTEIKVEPGTELGDTPPLTPPHGEVIKTEEPLTPENLPN